MTKKKLFNILLIDDDSFISDLYVIKFGNAGHTLTVASSATEALEKLREGNMYDAIATDIIMPEMSGVEFLEAINAENLAGEAVVIVLSNQDEPELVKQCRGLGAKAHIVKALNLPHEVLRQVECAIDKFKYDGHYGYCS